MCCMFTKANVKAVSSPFVCCVRSLDKAGDQYSVILKCGADKTVGKNAESPTSCFSLVFAKSFAVKVIKGLQKLLMSLSKNQRMMM